MVCFIARHWLPGSAPFGQYTRITPFSCNFGLPRTLYENNRCQTERSSKFRTLTKIESNVIKKLSVFVITKITKALGVSIEELIK